MEPGRLEDGGEPAGPDALLRRLEGLGIRTQTVHHPPVFTVEQSKRLRGELRGCHTKNLFVRDRKGVMWLVTCREDRRVDLAGLARQLGTGRLSFGSADRLMKYLGVIPGAVTPFAVINDHGRQVRVALDRGMQADAPWNFHPLDNAMTTSIEPADLVRFLEAEGHSPSWIEFE
jgi:Ala-tRNA(Pro) deacylase